MESKIRRILICFFICMLVFTGLSRAAASAMVAKVQVDYAKSGSLTYEVKGLGIVKSDARRYINLKAGYKIGTVKVKKGQKVKKGDVLFTYDLQQIKANMDVKKDALEKLELQYASIGLSAEGSDHTVDTENAIDTEIALTAIANAKEDVIEANEELGDVKMKVKEDKEKEHEDALLVLHNLQASAKKDEQAAIRSIEDAENELAVINEPETIARQKISDYREAVAGGKEDEISKAIKALYDFYYDGKYKDHQQKVNNAKREVDRAQDDLTTVQKKWKVTILNEFDQYSPNIELRNSYFEKLETKQRELETAQRTLQDAVDNLEEITEEDQKLEAAMDSYQVDVKNDSANMGNSVAALYELLTKGKIASQSQINTAQKKLSRAKEDEKQLQSDLQEKLANATSKVDKLQKELDAMEDGNYDYSKEEKEAKQTLKEAERTQKSQELQLDKTKEAFVSEKEAKAKQMKSDEYQRKILMVDILREQKELGDMQKLLSAKGRVEAPVSGIITENDLEQSITLSGQEKLIITSGGYELNMTADKEDMRYFSAGDDIEIKTGTDNNSVTSKIENIDLTDKKGQVSFTAVLPKGEYQIGASLEFTLTKNSVNYPQCIPVQALRQDSMGTYVLIVKESETILGKVGEAFRMNVKVLSKDSRNAAVDAALSEEDEIITDSNRSFQEGDRVRIYEME